MWILESEPLKDVSKRTLVSAVNDLQVDNPLASGKSHEPKYTFAYSFLGKHTGTDKKVSFSLENEVTWIHEYLICHVVFYSLPRVVWAITAQHLISLLFLTLYYGYCYAWKVVWWMKITSLH